jgi:type II secretory pathway pseudopilin PulG
MKAAPTKTRIANESERNDRGYVLLSLLLLVAVMIVVAAVAAPKIAFTIKRDRERELIHRGVQYTRAIRAFSRKFGRFPNSIDELQNANGQRFLRRRYKDPITGKDFKLLRLADVQFAGGPGVAALTQGSQRAMQAQGSDATAATATGGQNNASQTANAPDQDSVTGENQSTAAKTDANVAASPVTAAGDSIGTSRFGGGPIVGVASASKDHTIREFDHKNRYSDWQFYYDPSFDRGFAINGPTMKLSIPSASLRPGETPDAGQSQPQAQQ